MVGEKKKRLSKGSLFSFMLRIGLFGIQIAAGFNVRSKPGRELLTPTLLPVRRSTY